MVQRQREGLARYLYDLSKIAFATAVIGNLVARQYFDVITFVWGTMVALMFLWTAYLLDGVRELK